MDFLLLLAHLHHGLPARMVTIASIDDQACSSVGCSPPPRAAAPMPPQILHSATPRSPASQPRQPSSKPLQARVDENDENNNPNERVQEGDEDESSSDDRNDENIPDLVGMSDVLASRVPIMSAHDGRVPTDENFPFL